MDIKKTFGGFLQSAQRAAETAAPILNPIGVAIQKKVEDQFKPAPPPAPVPVPKPADPMAALGPEQKTKLQNAIDGKSGPAAQTFAQAAVAQASTLPPEQAAQLLKVASLNPGGPESVALAKVFASPTWLSSTPAQKGQILDVASTASPKGLESLADLAQQGKLNSPDANGGTLLSNLSKLATHTQAAELRGPNEPSTSRQNILDDVLRDTANPQSIHQGPADTCSVTSSQYELARRNPGEYARIMAGLTGPDAKVQMAGGGTLDLHIESIDRQPNDTRSGSERLFQSAAIEFGNGASNRYNPETDETRAVVNGQPTGPARTGLTENEARDVNRALFNRQNAQVFDMHSPGDPRLADRVVAHLETADRSKPITLNFTQPGGRGHAVAFDHIENGRVFFRNPTKPENGRSNLANAQVHPNGLESMSIQDFKRQGRTVTGEL
jgi:hypothetical protein